MEQKKALIAQVKQRYSFISSCLSERARRIWAASEAITIGCGGDSIVYEATGISRVTITQGKNEIQNGEIKEDLDRIRRKGNGRKKLITYDPALLKDLDKLKGGIHFAGLMLSYEDEPPELTSSWRDGLSSNLARI